MPVDVATEIEIDRPRAEVAEFASDPDNVPSWYENIASIEWQTPLELDGVSLGQCLPRPAESDCQVAECTIQTFGST